MGYCPHCGARGDASERERVYAAWLERRRERLEAVYDDRSPEAGAYRASVLAELVQVLGPGGDLAPALLGYTEPRRRHWPPSMPPSMSHDHDDFAGSDACRYRAFVCRASVDEACRTLYLRAVLEELYGEVTDEEVAQMLDFTHRLAARIASDRKKAPGGARSKVSARRGGARVRRVQL